MSIPDSLLWSYFELLTDVPSEEIATLRQGIESGRMNPRDVKARLARLIAAQYHGEEAAQRAEEDFRKAFSKGELPSVIDPSEVSPEESGAARVLVAAGLVASMREARRKIAEGALAVYAPGSTSPTIVRDPESRLDTSHDPVVRLGRHFRRIVWKRPAGQRM